MESPLEPRVHLLERLATQQLVLNDQLITVTARLGEEHTLYQERQTLLTALVVQHDTRMAQLESLLQAIKDLLEHRNGH